jgi:hypothetical protein
MFLVYKYSNAFLNVFSKRRSSGSRWNDRNGGIREEEERGIREKVLHSSLWDAPMNNPIPSVRGFSQR